MGIWDTITDAAGKVSDAVGGAIDTAGKAISGAGQAVQNAVDSGADWVDKHVDSAVDSFEHSALGDNVVGHALGDTVKTVTHFDTGVVSGATTLVSGTMGLAGGAMQYATDSQFRDHTNQTIGYVASHPGDVASAVWNHGVDAFEKDPAHALGQVVGVVGTAVLTAGAGSVGDVGEGGALAADGANIASKAGDVATVAADAADVANLASKTGEAANVAADGADAVSLSTAAQTAIAAEPKGVPTIGDLDQITAQIAKDPDIPFKYIPDGCYARAHVMADQLNDLGVSSDKVFAFGNLSAKNDVFTDGVNWWYHVAPKVDAVNPETGLAEARVIDPGIADRSLSVDEWVKSINPGGDPVTVDFQPQTAYTPSFGPGDYVTGQTLADHLPAARQTLEEYKSILEQILTGSGH